MRKSTFTQASTALLSLVFLGVACDGDDDVLSDTQKDATASSEGGGSSSSSGGDGLDAAADGFADSADANSGNGTKFTVVNDLVTVADSSIRLCFLTTAGSGAPTLEDVVDQPALPVGGVSAAGVVEIELSRAVEGSSVRPIAFYTNSLEAFGLADKSCKELVSKLEFVEKLRPDAVDAIAPEFANSGDLLVEGADFELGQSIAGASVSQAAKHILLLSGCPAKATNADGECGLSYVPGTNNDFRTFVYDVAPPSGAGPQVLYLFASWSGLKATLDYDDSSSELAWLTYAGPDTVKLNGPGTAGAFEFQMESGPVTGWLQGASAFASLESVASLPAPDGSDLPPYETAAQSMLELSGVESAQLQSLNAAVIMSVGNAFGADLPLAYHHLIVPILP